MSSYLKKLRRPPKRPREVRCPECQKVSFTRDLKKLGSRYHCPLCDAYIGTSKQLPRFRA